MTNNEPKVAATQPATNVEATAEGVQTPAIKTESGLGIVLPSNVRKVELNGVVADEADEQEKLLFIRQYIRNSMLRQFGISEIRKTPVTAGKIYFNEGNATRLKLPAVKEHGNGSWAETLEQYYERSKPEVKKWLTKAFQNADVTMEMVGAIG